MAHTVSHYIPAGRTARFKAGEKEIQVQTEFAPRPTPRITSTILVSGEVVKKLETPLESPISSPQELDDVERMLLKQHSSVLKRAKDISEGNQTFSAFDTFRAKLNISAKKKEPGLAERAGSEVTSSGKAVERVTVNPEVRADELSESDRVSVAKRTTLERLYAIEGAAKIHTISCGGDFLSEKNRVDFKAEFPKLFKHLPELVEIFGELPSGRGRENGTYEVEAGKLYMVSHCGFIYLLVMKRKPKGGSIEEVIKAALET